MSDQERKEYKQVNRLFDANHTRAKHRERVRREMEAVKAGRVDGMIEAFEKAAELDRLFVSLSKIAATPKERAWIDRFLDSMRLGESGLGLAYDALLLGAKFGAEPQAAKEIEDSEKRIIARLDSIDKKISPRAQTKNAEKGFDAAMWKRDHKTRPPKGPEPRIDPEALKAAVAEIQRRVKEGKGKLTRTQAVRDVRRGMNLWKVKESYLYRQCYPRKDT